MLHLRTQYNDLFLSTTYSNEHDLHLTLCDQNCLQGFNPKFLIVLLFALLFSNDFGS